MKTPKLLLSFFCFMLLFMNTQCDDDDEVQEPCGQMVVVDSGFYDSAESGFYDLISAEIEDNCLNINISASGCDGSTWSMVLVDSGAVAESSPEQRFLKFVFTNQEVCLAVFTQERSFDLSTLQIDGSHEIILNIEDFPEPLTYTY
ncbi:hypothetical protein [Psychroserpens algicola]|uniref:hypothetical protein n=1 Tax=Psychroserpens algicola TaxID=1719034 RepID=UPI001953C5F8|nr:hypothetical protein [Psychroserpens algicola]